MLRPLAAALVLGLLATCSSPSRPGEDLDRTSSGGFGFDEPALDPTDLDLLCRALAKGVLSLEDLGVGIRGLGGEKGPIVNLEDVTAGLEDADRLVVVERTEKGAPWQHRLGSLTSGVLVAVDEGGADLGAFPLGRTDVRAEITAFLASVRVAQRFENPFGEEIDAVYVFPLPRRAGLRTS